MSYIKKNLSFKLCKYLYHPPSILVDWNQVCFTTWSAMLNTVYSEIIAFGDFNVDLKNASTSARWIRSVIMPLGLSQLLKDPTRVEESSSALINHLYTSKTNNIKCSIVLECSLSDH